MDRIGDEAEYGAGRNDLYIANDEHGFCIEAKVACSKLGAPPTGSREKGTDLFTSHRPLLADSVEKVPSRFLLTKERARR